MRRRDAIIAKVMARVQVDAKTGCHVWTGPDSGKTGAGAGYGRMHLDGQTVAVHLVVFTHHFGYIPGKKRVDHLCNNRRCCNPEHLELVTQKENCRRRELRRRVQEWPAE